MELKEFIFKHELTLNVKYLKWENEYYVQFPNVLYSRWEDTQIRGVLLGKGETIQDAIQDFINIINDRWMFYDNKFGSRVSEKIEGLEKDKINKGVKT